MYPLGISDSAVIRWPSYRTELVHTDQYHHRTTERLAKHPGGGAAWTKSSVASWRGFWCGMGVENWEIVGKCVDTKWGLTQQISIQYGHDLIMTLT